jgi:hypothetical protein
MAFGVWDYVVFITTLLISAGIGVAVRFTGGKQKTTDVRFNRIFGFDETIEDFILGISLGQSEHANIACVVLTYGKFHQLDNVAWGVE